MEAYFEAKARLFDPSSPLHARTAVVCVDDDAGRAMARRAGNAVTVSAEGLQADWRAEDIEDLDRGAQEFTAVDPAGVHHRLRIPIPGRYNVANALVALAILDAVGGIAGAGVAGYPHRIGSRAAGSRRPGPGLPRRGRLRPQTGCAAGGSETLRRPEAGLAVVFGAGGDRGSRKRRSMGEIAAELARPGDRHRRQSPQRGSALIRGEIMAGASGIGCGAEVIELGDRRAAIAYAVSWAARVTPW